MVALHDVKKYIRYLFDSKSFGPSFDAGGISDQALQTAELIPGSERGPAITIRGIMPRQVALLTRDVASPTVRPGIAALLLGCADGVGRHLQLRSPTIVRAS